MSAPAPILELRGITKRFSTELDMAARLLNLFGAGYRQQTVHAVDGVDLVVGRGEVVGLVGESGCGKSTLGRIIAGIHQPTEGRLFYEDRDVAQLDAEAKRRFVIKLQMIFQDPMSSLNPRKRVKEIIGEAPLVHGLVKPDDIDAYVADLLERVGLDPSYRRRLPHQFSGGQRQRIGIARALAVQPDFLICDEAVAALDVSIQAQILNLFMDLKDDFDLTYLFISHDLGVVHHLAERIVIMYLGRVIEAAPTGDFFREPNHPYSQALLREVPRLDRRGTAFQPIKGELPSPLDPPPGCHFHPRCPFAMPRCRDERPALTRVGPDRWSACHLNDGDG